MHVPSDAYLALPPTPGQSPVPSVYVTPPELRKASYDGSTRGPGLHNNAPDAAARASVQLLPAADIECAMPKQPAAMQLLPDSEGVVADPEEPGGAHAHGDESATYVLEADQAPFTNAFSALDSNGGGSISKEELYRRLHELGTRTTDTELSAMLYEIDHNKDKGIDYPEFLLFLVYSYFVGQAGGLGDGFKCKHSDQGHPKDLTILV